MIYNSLSIILALKMCDSASVIRTIVIISYIELSNSQFKHYLILFPGLDNSIFMIAFIYGKNIYLYINNIRILGYKSKISRN